MIKIRNPIWLFVVAILFINGCAKGPPDECPKCGNPFIVVKEVTAKGTKDYVACKNCYIVKKDNGIEGHVSKYKFEIPK